MCGDDRNAQGLSWPRADAFAEDTAEIAAAEPEDEMRLIAGRLDHHDFTGQAIGIEQDVFRAKPVDEVAAHGVGKLDWKLGAPCRQAP